MNDIPKAAIMAARMYSDGEQRKGRSIKQCICVAAIQYGVSYLDLATYIDGAGLRAIAEDQGFLDLSDVHSLAMDVLSTAEGERQTAHAFFGCPDWYVVDGELLEKLAVAAGYDS